MFDQGDIRKLMEEIDRYLAAVELFRSHGCEPTWRPEVAADSTRSATLAISRRQPSDIHLH
jgi:hypothetical protein